MKGSENPPGQQREAADRRHCAEPTHACQYEGIEGAREDERSGHEGPTRPDPETSRPSLEHQPEEEKCQCVVHLVPDRDLEGVQIRRLQAAFESVSSERAEADGEEGRDASNYEEVTFHIPGFSTEELYRKEGHPRARRKEDEDPDSMWER